MRTPVLVCALVAGLAPIALGDGSTVIYQHNSFYDDPNNTGYPFYAVYYPSLQVTIMHAVDGQTFAFEATFEDSGDPNGPYLGPGDINYIVADPNAGPVTLTIIGHNGHEYGAANVGAIVLNADGVVGVIQGLTISGVLGAAGPSHSLYAGSIDIGTSIVDTVEISEVSGPITIGDRLEADVTFGVLDDFSVEGGTVNCPTIRVFNHYAGNMQVAGSLCELAFSSGVSGIVRVEGAVDSLSVESDGLTGAIEVTESVDLASIGGGVGGSLSIGADGGYLDEAAITGGVAGTFTVGDWRGGSIDGDVTGAIVVVNDLGMAMEQAAVYGNLAGTLTVGNDVHRFFTTGLDGGQVTVGGNVEVFDAYDAAGDVIVEGDISGYLALNGGACNVWVKNAVGPQGLIYIYGAERTTLTGAVRIDKSLEGWVFVDGDLGDPNDDLAGGHTIVNGSFGSADPNQAAARILIGGVLLGDTTFIAFNYDALGDDTWRNGSYVEINETAHYGPSPGEHVLLLNVYKADMNNDGAVDIDDINPFVTALSDAEEFSFDYLGLGGTAADDYLGGSRVPKGDLNCDDVLDIYDINPFVDRITQGCLMAECGDCAEDDSGDPLNAAELAWLLEAAILPELSDELVELIGQCVQALDDEVLRAYWEAVYANLVNDGP